MRLHISTPYAGISYNIWSKAMYPYGLRRALFDECRRERAFDRRKVEEDSRRRADKAGGERTSRERDVGILTGEMAASAGEQSELDDRTRCRKIEFRQLHRHQGTASHQSGGKLTTDCDTVPESGRSVSVRRQIPASCQIGRRGSRQISDIRRDPQSPQRNHATA